MINNILIKALSGFGIIAIIFGIGFYSGYKVKANAINSYNARQEVKLASLQARYDNVSATAQSDYLTMFNEVINESNPIINNNVSNHHKLWDFYKQTYFSRELSKDKSTSPVDESTTRRLENCRLNTIQLEYLQQYISGIEKIQQ